MPLWRYRITVHNETKTAELRSSNPQGWLPRAVQATFPEVAARHADDVLRLRLQTVDGVKQSWRATLHDELGDLIVEVTQARV